MIKMLVGLCCIALLAGCGDKAPLDLKLPDGTTPDIQKLLTQAWPKIKENCPGLDRFADALKFKGIEDNYAVSVVYQIPESGTSIPDHYMAGGHTCYFDVSQDGKKLTVAKEGCKAVCLGRAIQRDEAINQGDLVIPLDTMQPIQATVATPASEAAIATKPGHECLTVFDVNKATGQIVEKPKPAHCVK